MQFEFDGDDDAAEPLFQHRRAVTEFEFVGRHAARGLFALVEELDRHERGVELLAVGADVLHGRGADRAGNAGERLDARVAVLDGPRHEVVPGLAGLHAQANARQRSGAIGSTSMPAWRS